ncbi:hypothetical protein V462_18255 [Pantoea ananatis 15320]|nr:hypothetical protein V462_18255 [Pantoea ananatis 15320]
MIRIVIIAVVFMVFIPRCRYSAFQGAFLAYIIDKNHYLSNN